MGCWWTQFYYSAMHKRKFIAASLNCSKLQIVGLFQTYQYRWYGVDVSWCQRFVFKEYSEEKDVWGDFIAITFRVNFGSMMSL